LLKVLHKRGLKITSVLVVGTLIINGEGELIGGVAQLIALKNIGRRWFLLMDGQT